ncbi:hypothetical protein C2R22_22045 (plasmid) [Salinigranum rubrum]|uniref:Uncharacterized protein n=1 Tax=Salinigranum rubrum TaxID=755307 RepID=A0A2I8VQN6_9EURY|nr:hypothetical protein C2R22_22045 [Salinigranum rubrum]
MEVGLVDISTIRRIALVLGLAALSPLVAEYLLGNTSNADRLSCQRARSDGSSTHEKRPSAETT